MAKSKKNDEKIIIRDIAFNKNYFKPLDFDECTLRNALDKLSEMAESVNKGHEISEEWINNSPLIYIEGQLRFQLKKFDDELPVSLEELETPSDFLHGRGFIHSLDCVYNSKVVFLFDFLDDIVTFSHYPDQLDEAALDKIALNLRALSFLVESQLTGAIKYQDIVFNAFSYTVWKKMGQKKFQPMIFGHM